jgi:SAM-dependent methyltransferase
MSTPFVQSLKETAGYVISKLRRNKINPNTLQYQKEHWKEEILHYNWDDSKLFGYNWGDPNEAETKQPNGRILGNYLKIKNEYLLPYINDRVVLEIGSGGGKWTQYMKSAQHIICVDLNDELFNYIKKHLPSEKITFYKTSGNELSGIADHSVDFIFSMDTFVRIPKEYIFDYFKEFARVLTPNGKICIHLPCSNIHGSVRHQFIDLSKKEIKKMCTDNGFKYFILDEDTLTHGIILKVNYAPK